MRVQVDQCGLTVLHKAAREGDVAMVELLLRERWLLCFDRDVELGLTFSSLMISLTSACVFIWCTGANLLEEEIVFTVGYAV